MKRSCESSLSEESTVDKKSRFAVNLSNISNVSLENIQISETVVESIAAEVIHSSDGSQITQDEDRLVAETNSDVFVQFMDITEPLTKLRSLLEQRTCKNLSDYKFYLQDFQELDPSKNLVNQCVQGEGLVQINADVTEKKGVKRINIIDVLKPLDEVALSPPASSPGETAYMELTSTTQKLKLPNSQHVTRWFSSPEFKKIQEKYEIPLDPFVWTTEHVKHWFNWACSHFNISQVEDLDMTGALLMITSNAGLMKKIPIEPTHLFWTHLELLRRFKIVGILEQVPSSHTFQLNKENTSKNTVKSRSKTPRIGAPRIAHEGSPGYSGQIQLWQFLLELLTDKDHRNFIQWVGNDGEFKLINPEMVAQLWGQRKNKPTMNYEKLSRALRYYYDGEMIAKVHGKRFVYKFVYDLKSLLGYDAATLNRLVSECATKHEPQVVTYSTVDSSSGSN